MQKDSQPSCADVTSMRSEWTAWSATSVRAATIAIYSHLIEAKRTASRPGVKIRNLSPHFRKMLVSAVRRGLNITEKIIGSKLTDAEAYKMEWQMMWDYHKRHAGQLWNTIDERGRNPEDLPRKWSNPVYPLYRLPRPFNKMSNCSIAPMEVKTAMKASDALG